MFSLAPIQTAPHHFQVVIAIAIVIFIIKRKMSKYIFYYSKVYLQPSCAVFLYWGSSMYT